MEKKLRRSEEAALKAYPVDMQPLVYQDLIEQFGGKTEIDVNAYPRHFFQEGYHQAEKDLALTWEDVKEIVRIADGMMYSADSLADIEKRLGIQPYYTEVLTRFKQFKETKDGNSTTNP